MNNERERNGNENELDGGDSDYIADADYDKYGSEADDEEFVKIKEKNNKIHEEVVADLKALRAKNGDYRGGSNPFDDDIAYYQDSDNANSPSSSETDDGGDDGGEKKKKRKGQQDILDTTHACQ